MSSPSLPPAPLRTAPPEDEASRRRRLLFVGTFGALAVLVLLSFRAILLPFVLGLVLAYVLHPVVTWMTRLRVAGRAMPRWLAVLTIYVVLLSTLTVTLVVGVPALSQQVRSFVVQEVPEIRQQAQQRWIPAVQGWSLRMRQRFTHEPAPAPGTTPAVALPVASDPVALVQQRLRGLDTAHVEDIVRVGSGIIGGIIGGVFRFFMTLMISAYLLVTQAQIVGFLRTMVRPSARGSFDDLVDRLDRGLSGVVRGQLLICLVNGVLSAVGFALAGLKHWPVMALLAGVMSIVPIFGSIMSSVPAVALGLTQSFGTALFVLLWILGIHQVEANLLNPKIMGDAAKIHPVLVVFSLLAGEHFFGILGALLAVPTMSVAQSIFLHWRRYALPWSEDAAE